MDEQLYKTGQWVAVRAHEGRVELLHDVALRVAGLGTQAEAVVGVLTSVSGFTRRDLASIMGDQNASRVLACLGAQRMVRPWSGSSAPETPPHLVHQFGYFDATADDPARAQTALTSAHVAIIGVGGIGALVLQHLLGAGVRAFLLVDGDTVDASNLNRQYLYGPDHVGRRKVDIARAYVEEHDDATVITSSSFITGPDDLDALAQPLGGASDFRPDFVFCAADEPPGFIDLWCADYAARHGAGLMTCGVGINRGHWGPLVQPGRTPCHACASEPRSPGTRPSSLTVSFGPVNSIVAAGAAAATIWALAGIRPAENLARTTVVDVAEPFLRTLPARDRQPGCVVSSCHPRSED